MKILAIRIKNIASLEGVTEIDFTQEPLVSAGIFAITGPTGAGKSTILDAMCLALYAQTPRYSTAEQRIDVIDVPGSTIKQNDVRALLRDGTAEGYAEVDFLAIDGHHYRANWSVRRARNKVDGSLQQAISTLRNLTTGTDIGGKKTELLPEIARLVGLNYEQFIRSVLLAQGDFTAFLKADKDQKASLLEKLTGTHIYSELSKKVYERFREADHQLKLLQQKQEGIVLLTSEELADFQLRKKARTKDLEQLEKRIEQNAKEIQWHEDLDQFRKQVDQAQRDMTTCLKVQTESAERQRYFRQVQHVQAVRATVELHEEAAAQLIQRREKSESIFQQQQRLEEQLAEAERDWTEATARFDQQTLAQETAKPQLAAAAKLDVQVEAQEADLNKAKEQLKSRHSLWEKSKQSVADKQKEQEVLSRQIDFHQEWVAKRIARQPVAENHTFIVTKLEEAKRHLESMVRASQELERLRGEMELVNSKFAEANHLSQDLTGKLTIAQENYQVLRQQASGIPLSDLRQENKDLSVALEELGTAATHWTRLYRVHQEVEEWQKKIIDHKNKLASYETQFKDVEAALQAITEQRKVSVAMLEKATIAASADVEHLRNQLSDGQPCPVCGSESHPYAHENPQLNHVLDELRKVNNSIEASYRDQFSAHSRLHETISLQRQNIEQFRAELAGKKITLDELHQEWKQFSISLEVVDQAPHQLEAWFADRRQKLAQAKTQVEAKLDEHQQVQEHMDKQAENLQQLQSKHTAATHAVKDLEHEKESLSNRLALAQEGKATGQTHLEALLAEIQPHFPDEQWKDNWKSGPEDFLKIVRDFAAEWKTVTEALDRERGDLKVLAASLAGLQKEEKGLADEVSNGERDCSQKEATLKSLKTRRLELFEGQSVEAVEARLKLDLSEAESQMKAKKRVQEQLLIKQAELEAGGKEMKFEMARLEKRTAELAIKLDQWLDAYHTSQAGATPDTPGERKLNKEILRTLLTHPEEWIAEEREALLGIERAVMHAGSILDERKRKMAEHESQRPSAESLDGLKERAETEKERRAEWQRDLSEIGYQLKQDVANKLRLGDVLLEIQKQATVVENWSKLNELIGSADGKKFRQVAQEYTLDVLLNYANVHLEVLTKRYRLQRIPNTLGLQVLDQDMGDEVRTVYSLSGGESFLVSLALALGLASLSASRMNVESLFIDEGFGSLDSNTLNIAMDALERLHNQGRKVGVISHVQEMTERILVRISVSKEQSGKSRVAVH